MTDKRFSVAGVSTLNGKTKLRFANDQMRIKILAKNGHNDVDLINLPHEMTKAEIVAHLRSISYGQGNAAVLGAIEHVEGKYSPAKTSKAAAKEAVMA